MAYGGDDGVRSTTSAVALVATAEMANLLAIYFLVQIVMGRHLNVGEPAIILVVIVVFVLNYGHYILRGRVAGLALIFRDESREKLRRRGVLMWAYISLSILGCVALAWATFEILPPAELRHRIQ
jgi:hypothetical protein